MRRTLLLNTDWSPLNFVTPVRALNLLMKGRAEIISMGERQSLWDESMTTSTRSFEMPATLRLLERVNRKISSPRFRKWVLFNRDGWTCQYCGINLDWQTITIDHVIPRSRGGLTTWKNCVASCKKCNWKKGSRTLFESGLNLRRPPGEPRVIHYWEVSQSTSWHPDWTTFFPSDIYRS